MSDELKPCPFCGNEATAENYVIEAQVICLGCRAKIVRHNGAKHDNGLPESIAAWNSRADEPALQQQGEAVAWFTEDHLTDRSATTYDKAIADRWVAKGWPVTPLYTHPPKPVVSDAQLDVIALNAMRECWDVMESDQSDDADIAELQARSKVQIIIRDALEKSE